MYELNILFVAFIVFIVGILSLKIKVTPIFLEVIAGLIVGNFFLFEPNQTLNILSGMGILVLMYMAGLEIDFDFLKKKIKPSLYIGGLNFFIPFFGISFFCYYIYNMLFIQAILIALALSTTSIAIVFPILASKGKLTQDMKLILSSVMIVDIICMIFLGFFSSAFSYLTLIFIVFMALLTYFFPYLGRKIFKKKGEKTIAIELRFVLFSLLALSFTSEHVGLEPALIAFFFGMLTSSFVVEHIELQKQLNGIAFGFLTPIFFFLTGTKIKLFLAQESIVFLIILFLIAYLSKYYSALFAIKKYFKTNASYYAKLFNFRLTFGFIVIIFGLERAIISEEVFSVIGIIIILSSLSGFLAKEK